MKPIPIRRHAPNRRARSLAVAARALDQHTLFILFLLLATGLAIATIVASATAAPSSEKPGTERGERLVPERSEKFVNERLGLTRFTTQSLLIATSGTAITVPLDLDGQHVTLRLEPSTLRSPDFQVLVPGPNGEMQSVPAPPSETYRGEVTEWPGSRAAGAVHGAQMTVAIARDEGPLYFVQPLADANPDAAPNAHVVYRAEDATSSGTCATTEPSAVVEGEKGGNSTLAGALTADLALDCDHELYMLNGSSIDNTVLDVERVISAVNLVYDRDCGIQHRIVRVIVRNAEPDPYSSTSPDTLLDQFRNHWNAAQTGIARDVAHLMTGKDINGGTIGIASVGVVCNRSRAYGLSQTRYSTNASRRCALTAHELGHEWNAQHCDGVSPCNIMCSSINGCNGIGLPNFEPMGANAIKAFAASRTCLDHPTTPVESTANAAAGVRLSASPSPFRTSTKLSYFLPIAFATTLSIFDLSGRRLATLTNGVEDPGWHSRTWDGTGKDGARLEPGVYQARIEVAGRTRAQKVVLIE